MKSYKNITKNEWIVINIANEAGYDKLSWEERIIKGKEIINAYFDGSFEPEKDDYLLIKRLNEVKELLNGSATQEPNIYLDATASGVQIISAITLDLESGAKVNIGTKYRKDLYTDIAKDIKEMFNIEFSREQIKKPIMTYFYNSKSNIEKYLGDEMAEVFFNYMEKGFEKPVKLMKLINSSFEPRKEYKWTLPDLIVKHPIEKTIIEELPYKDISVKYTYKINEADSNQWRGILPNLIHSLDAYILRYVVKHMSERGIVIHTIHDSFQVPVSKANILIDVYKEAFISMIEENILPNILDELYGIKITYNEDNKIKMIKAIKESEYMLS